MGIPLDQPKDDLVFYQLPHRDQSWHFNMIGLGMQFLEKLVQITPIDFGQVPKGQASALRNVGTVQTLVQQGGAMPEQILRRLFAGLKDVVHQFHLLNCRYLPPFKRFRITGEQLNTVEAYAVIDDRKDINVPVNFDFQGTLLNTNKGAVAQALMSLGQVLFSPLALQFGLTSAEKMYNWATDLIKSFERDPARYVQKPPGVTDLPKITAEEAALIISQGRLPIDTQPEEQPQEHLQKLMAFQQQPEYQVIVVGGREPMFQMYLQHIQQMILMQQQMMAQQQAAAAEFSQMMGKQGGEGGKGPSGEVPPPQTETGSADELAGAIQGQTGTVA
jgi:hypothetical protein